MIWPDEDEQFGWPSDIPREETVKAFELFFSKMGFVRTQNAELEQGYEKVAIYARDATATHVARQILQKPYVGCWTSKLGSEVDIRHATINSIEGIAYGSVALILKRKYDGRPPSIPELFPPPPKLVSPLGKTLLR